MAFTRFCCKANLFCIEFVTCMAPQSNRKTLLTLIVAAFAGLALIILFLKMGMSDQAGNEHAGSVVKGTTLSLDPSPRLDNFR